MVFVEQENHIPESTFLIVGDAARFLPEEVVASCAHKISEALLAHPNTMLQYKPDEILDSIQKGWAVVALGKGFQTVGFAQFWEYGFNEDGQQILEFGSWLSFREGVGGKILKQAISLGKRINPNAQLIAIAEEENLKAQGILKKMGSEEIGSKFSPVIRTVKGEAARMKIFDITKADERLEGVFL